MSATDANAQFWSRVFTPGKDFRGDARERLHKCHLEKLLKPARTLAMAAENDLETKYYLQALENQIFLSFRTNLATILSTNPQCESE